MPIQKCDLDGKPGYKWGSSGTCYTYTEGDDASEKAAKKKAIKQALAIGGGKMPGAVSGAAHKAVKKMSAKKLKTRDLKGVEIMAADVKVYGTGDADPEGENRTVEDLEKIAEDSNRASDLLAPLKIGHSKKQALLANSGLAIDEEPAAGWLTNFRVKGNKLVADVKRVPDKLASLAESGAFRVRSPETGPWTDQATQETYPEVVRGLALLGTTPPAFQTLDDLVKAYSADEVDTAALIRADEPVDEPDLLTSRYAAGDVVWDSEKGAQDVMGDLCKALDPTSMDENRPAKFWVQDVMLSNGGGRALVNDYSGDSSEAWVVPFAFNSDGDPVPSDRSTWVLAQQAWIEKASAGAAIASAASTNAAPSASSDQTYAAGDGSRKSGDISGMPREDPAPPDDGSPDDGNGTEEEFTAEEKTGLKRLLSLFKSDDSDDDKTPQLKLDPEAVKAFAAAAGVPDETDPVKILAAIEEGEKKAAEPVKPADERIPEGMVLFAADEKQKLEAMAKEGVEANTKLKATQRDHFLKEYARKGKISPADFDKWGQDYDDLGEERVGEILDRLPVDENIVRTFGAAELDGLDFDISRDNAGGEEQYYAYCVATGMPYEGPLNRAGAES